MSEFSIDLSGLNAETLAEKGDLMQAAILETVGSLGAQLLERVQAKVSGQVLHVVSGQLLSDLTMQAAAYVDGICQTSVGIDEGQPSYIYAYVNEFGGSGWYPIVPVNANYLAFMGRDGKQVFTKLVNHPPAKERSYLRSSLEEMQDQIYTEIKASVAEVFAA